MRKALIFLMLITWMMSKGQGVPLDKYIADTLRLSKFKANKVILYRLNGVTFCAGYNDFIKMYTGIWKRYKEDQKYLIKAKKKGEYFNPDFSPRWNVLDSVYNVLITEIKHKDTIRINHIVFDKVGFGTWNNFFPELIEKNKCAIFDDNNEQQFIIIRHKGSWY